MPEGTVSRNFIELAIDKDLKTPEEKLEFIKKVAMPGGPWNIRALPFGKDMVTNITGEMIKAAINGFIDKLSKEKPAKKEAQPELPKAEKTTTLGDIDALASLKASMESGADK